MTAHEDISDSTDWIGTPIAKLEPLEAGLRCEICKDFYTAPVLTACCHTFCSGCIRRSLSSVNASRKCPLCWAPFDEGQLRKNKVVEELVKTYQLAREDILVLAKAVRDRVMNDSITRGKKRKLEETARDAGRQDGEPSPRKTRSQAQRGSRVIAESAEPEEVLLGDGEDIEYQPDDGNVSCPICQKRMPEAQVFAHLDTHSEDKLAPARSNTNAGVSINAQTITPAMTPLPTLSYNLMPDTQLRKKLRELGIPADGNKQILSRRHIEWRNLVNANCDSSHPKTKAELLRELSKWERTQNAVHNSYSRTNDSTVMEKDFDRDGWSSNHNSDFQSLILAARAKVKIKQQDQADPGSANDTTPMDSRPQLEQPPSSVQTGAMDLTSPENIPKTNGFRAT